MTFLFYRAVTVLVFFHGGMCTYSFPGYIPNSVIRGLMSYKPLVEEEIPEPYRPPEIMKLVQVEPQTHEVDMYSWLLEKLVNKCHYAGVNDASSVVAVMTEIFQLSPQRTEDVTHALVEHLRYEADFDLISFLTCFSDEDTLKRRFGEEVYMNLFKTHTKTKRAPSSEIRSISSEFSSLPSPSKVNYNIAKQHVPSAATSYTTRPKTQSSSYSSFSVPSALKLKWTSKGRAASASTALTTIPKRHTEIAVSTSYLSEQRTLLSSATTKLSLTLPSESTTLTFIPSDESITASAGRRIEALRSALKRSSINDVLSPKRRHRPSSVTFSPTYSESLRRTTSAEPFVGENPIEQEKSPVDFITTLLESTSVLSEADQMLKEMIQKPWFPEAYMKGIDRQATMDNVFYGLCKWLGGARVDFF